MSIVPLAQFIRNAVAIEQAARVFYADLAAGTRDPRVKAFLAEMSAQESEHARQIEEFGTKLAGGQLPQKPDFAVEDVECAPGWRDATDLTLDQALAVAAESETQAWLFYDSVADRLQGPAAEFFRVLGKTELEHLKRLKTFKA